MTAQDVLDFWFGAEPRLWFSKDDGFDEEIRSKFGSLLEKARAGQLSDWEQDLKGLQALIILLDQFSRNLYRGSGEAFAKDAYALRLARDLLAHDDWQNLSETEKMFGIMPLMHSEDLQDQKDCLAQMELIGVEGSISAAKTHLEIIERFGRFPHRNGVLGRATSPDEQAFLDEGGFSG